MKQALTITLNHIVFYIEDDAYDKLKQYLDSIKRLFSDSPDRDEIVTDIESRIAERFQTVTSGAKEAVTLEDVEALITSMGTPEDLGGESQPDATPAQKRKMKKLYRDSDNRIIAGVAAGLGAYFGVDPVFVRILFVLSLFAGGFGILLYLVLWLLTPEAVTLSQKMEMQGDPVTLKNLEEAVKERLKKDSRTKQATGKIAQFFRNIFSLIGTVLRALGPILRIIFGVAFTVIGIAGIIGVTIGTVGAIINVPTPYMHPELIRFLLLIEESYLAPILGSVFILAIVPIAFILFAGLSLLKNRSVISQTTTGVLVGLWILAVIVTGVAASYILPRFDPDIPEVQFYYRHNPDYNQKYD